MRSLVVIAPVMPFLGDHLWRRPRAADDQPDSVFLARWQDAGERDHELLDEVAETRRVVELGHQARGDAGIKLRQPLRRAYVRGADGAARTRASSATSSTSRRSSSTTALSSARSSSRTSPCSGRGSARGCRP